MNTQYQAVRDWIVGRVQTAWADVHVVLAPPVISASQANLPYARVYSEFIELASETPVSQEMTMSWTITGVFARPAGHLDNFRIAQADALVTELLSETRPGSQGYGPVVKRVELHPQGANAQDDRIEIKVVFECKACVMRT